METPATDSPAKRFSRPPRPGSKRCTLAPSELARVREYGREAANRRRMRQRMENQNQAPPSTAQNLGIAPKIC